MSLIKRIHFLFYFLLSLLLLFLLSTPIRMTAVDLGRHIANGRELFFGNTNVLFKNHYSYTLENNIFINHHWLFGVIVFLLEQAVGFIGIQLFNMVVVLLSLWLLLKIMESNSNSNIASLLGIMAVFSFATRPEIRPENFGLLFITHTLYQLLAIIKNKKVTKKQLLLLSLQQLFWVNTHISFIFGVMLAGLLWFSSYILRKPKFCSKLNKQLLLLTISLSAVSLVNPNFIAGAIEPFNIFVDYGYSVVENQTLLFLWRVIAHPTFILYFAFMTFSVPIYILNFRQFNWFERVLYFIGATMGYLALRNIPIFAVFTLPTIAKGISFLLKDISTKHPISLSNKSMLLLLIQVYLLVFTTTLLGINQQKANLFNRKIGVIPEEQEVAKFILDNNISGPIFNNYDIGSYLVYYLYPKEKVFVDNRPEAYSKNFLQNIYIPMQQELDIWNKIVDEYQIKTVIFGIQDITPWAQNYLRLIENQPEWEKIYHDEYASVWVFKESK